MSSTADEPLELRHIAIVGGRLSEWNSLSEPQWKARIAEFAVVAESAGASWLTFRPLDRELPPNGGISASINRLGHCTVVVDPHTDGRQRLVDAVNALRRDGRPITDTTLAGVINAPAPCDPDLAIIHGTDTELPLALVWELAYCELVYVDAPWSDVSGEHLHKAIAEFAGRHRRFGGLD
jgi:undecaprenyl diphosphate synthase